MKLVWPDQLFLQGSLAAHCTGGRATSALTRSIYWNTRSGDVMLQELMGDFLQLNPFKSHSLLEAFSRSSG